MKDYGMTKVDEGELIQPNASGQGDALPSLFQMDTQIASARKHKRDITRSLAECLELVADPDIAHTMTYRLERKDRKTGKVKVITGPSAACAQLIAYSLGNIAYWASPPQVGAVNVLVMGFAQDLERGLMVSLPATRRIVGRNGVRYSDDMIELTSAVAASIAMRNAVLKLVPGAFTKRILDHAAEVVARGSGELAKRWAAALRWATSEGIAKEEVLEFLGLPDEKHVGPGDIARLLGAATAIREGEATVDELFRSVKKEAAAADADELTRRKPEPPPAPKPEPKPEPASSQEEQVAEFTEAVAEEFDGEEEEEEAPSKPGKVSAKDLDERARASWDPPPKKKTRAKKEKPAPAPELPAGPQGGDLKLVDKTQLDAAKRALQIHAREHFDAIWQLVLDAGIAEDADAILRLASVPPAMYLALLKDQNPQRSVLMMIGRG